MEPASFAPPAGPEASAFTVRRFLDDEAPEHAKWSEEPQHLPQQTPAYSA